jgi:hypothetical protein
MSDLRKAPIWYCFRCKNGSPQEEWKKRSSHRWGDCPKCGAPGSKWAYTVPFTLKETSGK